MPLCLPEPSPQWHGAHSRMGPQEQRLSSALEVTPTLCCNICFHAHFYLYYYYIFNFLFNPHLVGGFGSRHDPTAADRMLTAHSPALSQKQKGSV